jgi:hypothetical protein
MVYISERDLDLLKAYREVINEISVPFTLGEVLILTVKKPARRYYASVRYVYKAICDINKGFDLAYPKTSEKYRLVFDVKYKVDELMKKEKNILLYDAVCKVMLGPAPEFYLKPSSAKIIITHIRKKVFELENKRFLHDVEKTY